MFGTLALVFVIVAAGSHVGDALRLKQEEAILRKLPVAEAHDYYEVLVRRARRTKMLRAAALAAMFVLVYLWRRRLLGNG